MITIKNTGRGVRTFPDLKGVKHELRPGQSKSIDMHPHMERRLKNELRNKASRATFRIAGVDFGGSEAMNPDPHPSDAALRKAELEKARAANEERRQRQLDAARMSQGETETQTAADQHDEGADLENADDASDGDAGDSAQADETNTAGTDKPDDAPIERVKKPKGGK